MLLRKKMYVAAALSLVAFSPMRTSKAADLSVKAPNKEADQRFFLLIDDRVTFSWMPNGTDPGVWTRRPDGSINGTTAKQVYSFTHFDIWRYGTNFLSISMYKSDHNDPASPCIALGGVINTYAGNPATCAGSTEVYGSFRSTFGWNEIFNTKAFTEGPLHNISFEVGMDAGTQNTVLAPAKRSLVAGLQFAFDLPYKGYFNVAPMASWYFAGHNAATQCGFNATGIPGTTCLLDGNTSFEPTWAVETNYYMDLGFLPESMQFWSISGRASWYGKKGTQNNPLPSALPGNVATAVEFNSEPIRLTFDASKAIWGPKYSHYVDVWVAYRYWQNKLGLDHVKTAACNVTPGVSNNSCTESTLYSGITVKF